MPTHICAEKIYSYLNIYFFFISKIHSLLCQGTNFGKNKITNFNIAEIRNIYAKDNPRNNLEC